MGFFHGLCTITCHWREGVKYFLCFSDTLKVLKYRDKHVQGELAVTKSKISYISTGLVFSL